MTGIIPYQIPNVGSSGVIQQEGLGDTLASGLAGVLKAMQDRQKLDMEKKEFEEKQQYYKTLTEGSALDNQKKRDDIATEKRKLAAKDAGLAAFTQWAGQGAQQKDLGKILAGIKDPDTAQDVIDRVTSHFQEMAQAAQAQHQQTQADIATQTAPDVVGQAKTDATKSASDAAVAVATQGEQIRDAKATRQLHQAQAQKAIADAQSPGDPSARINSAINAWKTGAMTLGEAFKGAGADLPPGADAKMKFDPTVQTQRMAVYKATQKAAASASVVANSQIDELEKAGVKISRFTPLKEGVPFDLARSGIPEKEQQLLAAGGQLISQYNLAVSGKAVTDKEAMRNAHQLIPGAGDKAGTLQQKRLMRESMVQIMFDQSQGAQRPVSDIVASVIGAAKSRGAAPSTIKFLEESRMRALQYERNEAKHPDTSAPITATTEPATSDSLQNYLDSLGR